MAKKNLIFGIHAVMEAVKEGKDIEKVFAVPNINSYQKKELVWLLNSLRIPVSFVPVEKLNAISGKNHQGVIAYVSPVTYQILEDLVPTWFEQGKMPVVLLLDQVSDVRNFGAIARTAGCAGVDAIVIPMKGSAQINEEAVKTSSGALFSIPICRVNKLSETIVFLKDSGFHIIAATEKAELDYYAIDFSGPIAIILGSEDRGISSGLLPLCEDKVRIPVFGSIGSLNVSVATGVLVYEIVRQRAK
ncbi:MAG: 23S rRNA (guanosine(2251)-2'-O)-methyltransferase RlmB [Bacteroidota bacterium]